MNRRQVVMISRFAPWYELPFMPKANHDHCFELLKDFCQPLIQIFYIRFVDTPCFVRQPDILIEIVRAAIQQP